ncbi:ComF family protein [Paenibacillus sp. CMAA1364]
MIPWIVDPRCTICGRHIGCPDCTRVDGYERFFKSNRSAVAYNGMMKEWLGQYKYRGDERYSALLVMMLVKAYMRMRSEYSNMKSTSAWTMDIITCIPVSAIRLEERGFNQAEVLAVGLAERIHIPFIQLLVRARHTDKQSFKSRGDRIRDMQNVFRRDPDMFHHVGQILQSNHQALAVRPIRILVIDDIYTTGSTMNACAHVLQELEEALQHPVEIYSLTWARS